MARGRMIDKTLGSSRRFAAVQDHAGELTVFAQLVYVLAVSHADDFGRLEGDAQTVKLRIFPSSNKSETEFAKALEALHHAGLVVWYRVDGKDLLEITQFSEHQSGLHKRTRSKYSDPPGVVAEVPHSSNNHDGIPTVLTDRARQVVERYPELYRQYQKQPYLQSRMQTEKDLDAATQLCMAYADEDVERIIVAYLQIQDTHPKAKLLKGSRRTLPMLLTMAAPIATQLKIEANNNG